MPFTDRFSLFRRSDPVGYRSKYDSCLDQIDETHGGNVRNSNKAIKNEKRRSTIVTSTSRSSLVDISKSNMSGSRRILSFIQKGLHGGKSKSMSKMDNSEFLKICIERKNQEALKDIVPIPIRETAIQGHSKTLFHKIPKSNVRAKPLLRLDEDAKFLAIHSSLLLSHSDFCVKIISSSPMTDRKCSSGNKYELFLPSGTRSLGHTCHIVAGSKSEEQCPSCYSSQMSLFGKDDNNNRKMGYVFSCTSECERKKWLSVLTRVAKPNLQNDRRREISLNLWIQEAKNVTVKKKYFCEIYLDEVLHARTTTKVMTDMLFWGEEFNFSNLEDVKIITILLWKAHNDNRMKKKKSNQQLICQVNIDAKEVEQRNSIERWYSSSNNLSSSSTDTNYSSASHSCTSKSPNSNDIPVSPSIQTNNLTHLNTSILIMNDHYPMIRIKARYQNLEVLPINDYSNLVEYLDKYSVPLLLEIDSYLKVKNKEDLALNLISILHKQGNAVDFLSDLIFQEINRADDQNMILRGNTMASKSIEVYLKLIGEKYLNLTLSDFVNRVLGGDDDCEVDPQKEKLESHNVSSNNYSTLPHNIDKITPEYHLKQKQESLLMNVDMVWAKIISSAIYFPKDLKSVFIGLRTRLEKCSKNPSMQIAEQEYHLCDRIVSACIFLRYICPAILTPSLFGLLPEYPDNHKVSRTFTLVAKTIQTLANFSDLKSCKESYMMFMNGFIESQVGSMHKFLKEISTESTNTTSKSKINFTNSTTSEVDNHSKSDLYWENLSNTLCEDSIDLSLCLAKLHRQLEEYLKMIPAQKLSKTIEMLYGIIETINEKLRCKDIVPLTQSRIQYSQSYQNINDKTIINNEIITSQKSDSSYLTNSNTLTRLCNKKPKDVITTSKSSSVLQRPSMVKSCAVSYPTDISPIHTNNLMTQSMIEDRGDKSGVPQSTTISRDQLDKEWQEMLSESNVYNHSIGTRTMSSSCDDHTDNDKDTQSLGYHTMNVNTRSLNNNINKSSSPSPPSLISDINSLDSFIQPVSSKNSVKKCKQFQRVVESNYHTDYATNMAKQKERSRLNDNNIRRNSAALIKHQTVDQSLSTQSECIDSCSTETITSIRVNQMQRSNPSQHNNLINSSISMPSFGTALLNNEPPSAFRNGQMEYSHNINGSNKVMSSIGSGGLISNNDSTVNQMVPTIIYESRVKQMRNSLNNLHQTLNARMTQLLLADQTTIALELERVRLMNHICQTASKPNNENNGNPPNIGITNNTIQYNTQNSGNHNVHDAFISTQLSVKKYLEVAENVLVDAQQKLFNGDKIRNDTEKMIMQIFETNQSLQNTLINKLEGYSLYPDLLVHNPRPISTNVVNKYPQRSSPNVKYAKSNDVMMPNNKNSKNLSNLNISSSSQSNHSSISSGSSSAIIELVDAV